MPYRYEINKGYIDGPENTYKLDCPYCGKHNFETRDIKQMPWGVDTYETIACPECGKNFEIRPQYDFLGYVVFADELQMEKDRRN